MGSDKAARTLASLAFAAAALACNDTAPAAPKEVVRLGLLSSFTGRDEASSQAEKSAMELAVTEVNAAGGLLDGRRVEVVTADDEGDPERGQNAARRLIERDGVVAFVGPVSSRVAEAVVEVSVEAKVPHISCCATSPRLDTAAGQGERDRYFFRAIPKDVAQVPGLARAARECHACTRVALFHRDDGYGTPFAEALAPALTEEGDIEVVSTIAYDPDQASYRSEVELAAAAEPDCVVMISFVRDGARLRREWDVYAGRPVHWLGSEGVLGNTFTEMLSSESQAEGLLVTAPVFDPNTPENDDFTVAYRANFHRAPEVWTAQIYDSAALLMLAIARAGRLDGEAVRDALFEVAGPGPAQRGEFVVRPGTLGDGLAAIARGEDVNYHGASGALDFDDYGNVEADHALYDFGEDGLPRSLGLIRNGRPLPCP